VGAAGGTGHSPNDFKAMDDVAGPALGNGWTTVGRKGREVADQALHLMLPAPGRPGWLRCAGPYQPGLGWSGHRRCRSRLHGLRFCWRERTIGGHTYVPLDVDVLLPCRDTLGSRRAQAEARLSIFGVYCVDLELRTGTASAAHQRVRSRRRLGGRRSWSQGERRSPPAPLITLRL
jgi:hypothetical protein